MTVVGRVKGQRPWTSRDWLSAVFLWVFIGFATGFLYHQRDHLDAFSSLGILHLVAIVTLGIVSVTLLGVAQWVLFRNLAHALRLIESVQIAISLNFLNYLPAKAGLLGRGAYLHRVHDVPVNDYIGLTIRSKLISLAATSSVGAIIGLAFAPISNGLWVWGAGGLAVVALMSMVAYSWGYSVVTFIERLPLVRRLTQHVRYQQKRLGTSLVGGFAGLVTAAMFCRAARLYVIFAALGYPLDVGAVIVMEAVNGVVGVIALLPGNLGLREGAMFSVALAFGVPWNIVVPAVLLDRVATLVVPLAIGPCVTHRLSRRMLRRVSPEGF